MELLRLAEGVHYLRGAVNCGLVETESGLLAVDTGLDRGAANRIVRAAEELGRPLVAILNTHAHADHHGGNAQLVRKLGLPVYAPAVEEAVIREPRYEPVYLFGGAEPVGALVNKFLQAEPSPVDHVVRPGETVVIDGRALEVVDLAGHSLAQVGVLTDPGPGEGVLFAADSFFGTDALAKHGVPFLVDAGRTWESIQHLDDYAPAWYVPGHGEALGDIRDDTFSANFASLSLAFEWLGERLRGEPAGTEDLLVEFAPAMGMRLSDAATYVLNRTTLLGFLSAMTRNQAVEFVIDGGRWLWMARE
ncbi:MAG TPA: MBL fold metallo-hydrolase [Longimicrobiaceae bacterium]|nr:MBL fold metallo-hydrolase [Longimicrobiaceae bacterium]